MRLFEYESKKILSELGVPIPRGVIVRRGENIAERIREAGLQPPLVVKSQVLVGGRGRAGGILFASSIDGAVDAAKKLFETPIHGLSPHHILVEEALEHKLELYLAIALDRAARRPVLLASREGGVEVEEVAKRRPEAIIRAVIDPWLGLRGYVARRVGLSLGLRGRLLRGFEAIALALYRAWKMLDAELVEINPLAVVGDQLVALDAKVIVDDNALNRHPGLGDRGLSVTGEYTEFETRAQKLGLPLVELGREGVAVVGNGAGLTMATMDLVYERGGQPSVFLDIGGGASADRVRAALALLASHTKSRSILMNVFGGITRCDEVAQGIVLALHELDLGKPLVVRLAGTKESEGRRILAEAGVEVYNDPVEAVDRAIELAGKRRIR
ncbi:Succinyl-CoA ligase [ADP-forming] beta chain [Pyrodictium delaneyi]|uniref:Succinate--CoA ligase [ADP-forming] subunit beta n=1 Tax=Pyrodictium delaneyi TaxID=1273541 RepID=A0A0P0N3Z5_9CREN|nr:ADP-forming succinate--CoA ligase subunit beta [Pyrodictium delaneyi]ALL00844.1 Succinyl-CoA ligase [ADP-forming] beta chain [Pyrodictium delaneyi]OWJ55526.1 succinate--CoA ligase subunit beta [Pyrodictium delaneyi]